MSKDPDLERDLDRLISRIVLPEHDRWVPNSTVAGRRPAWLLPAGAVAVVVALAVAVGAQSAGDGAASRSPRALTSPPLLTRPPSSELPSTPPGSTPPRGSALLTAIVDFTDDVSSMAADDQAFAAVTKSQPLSIVVVEFGGQRHTIAATRGRTPFLVPHGALRGDLVAYTETEITHDLSVPAKVVWHVMVANWRTGAVTELDAIPGEAAVAPHDPDRMPKAFTNGRDVIWMRPPPPDLNVVTGELMLWRGGVSRSVYRGEISYALADDGRIAIAGMNCPPAAMLRLCPGGTQWQLYLLDGDTNALRRIGTRDPQDGGGQPAFAGTWVVWPRVSGAPVQVSTVDMFDLSTRNTRSLTDVQCSWIGTTVSDVVFGCPNSVMRTYPVVGTSPRFEANEAGTNYLLADPHAIIGRRTDNSWVIRRVP